MQKQLIILGENVTLDVTRYNTWRYARARTELHVSFYTERTQFKQTLVAGKVAIAYGDYRDYDFVKATLQAQRERIQLMICLRNPY